MFHAFEHPKSTLIDTADSSRAVVGSGAFTLLRIVVGSGAFTLLRMVVGLIMTAHGLQKLGDLAAFEEQVRLLGIPAPEVASKLAVAGELLGGLGLLVGFITPVAAFGVLSTMLVAIVNVHLKHGLFARDNGFEYPLILASAALFFLLNGGGPLSVDGSIARWRANRRKLRRPNPATAGAAEPEGVTRTVQPAAHTPIGDAIRGPSRR